MRKFKSAYHKAAPNHVGAASGINILNILADVYSDIFNSADDKDILSLKQRLHGTVNINDLSVINWSIQILWKLLQKFKI